MASKKTQTAAKKPAKKAANTPATKAAKKSPSKKAAKKPAKKAAKKSPSKKAAKKPAKKVAKKSPSKKPAKKAAKKSPSKKAAKKAPSKKAAKKAPSKKAAKKTPSTKAAKKSPSTKAAKKSPSTKAAKKSPSTKSPKTAQAPTGQKTIVQHVFLPTTPAAVYRMLTDPTEHGAFTGTECSGEPVEGGAFTASSGYISGRYETLEQDHLIVASWQTTEWPRGAPASRLEFVLEGVDGGTELTMTHAELPPTQAEDYRQGWLDHYWTPMRAALAGKV